MIIIIANGNDVHSAMPVTHFSSSQSKELRSTLPGTGLNITKLEPKNTRMWRMEKIWQRDGQIVPTRQ